MEWLLYEAEVTLMLKKRKLFAGKIDLPGGGIRPGRLGLVERPKTAVKNRENLMTQTELRSFLNLCDVFWWFVPNFASVCGLFNKTLRKD